MMYIYYEVQALLPDSCIGCWLGAAPLVDRKLKYNV